MSVPPEIAALFPKIVQSDCTQTSPKDRLYNCIGFAADPSRLRWWWPIGRTFWPRNVPRELTLDAFEAAFSAVGYARFDPETEGLQLGIEKIAIFVAADGTPTHAARQLQDGTWTSKLGKLEDIRHPLKQIEGASYGVVARIMSRPRPPAKAEPAAPGSEEA